MKKEDYAKITKGEEKNNNKKKDKENSKKSWTTIKRNPITKKIEIINPPNYNELKEKIAKDKIHNITEEMINRWNKFRDEDIELRGDLSVYFNYKEEINEMVIEDLEIEDLIYEKNKYDSDDPDYSDDENNKHLIY